MKHIYIFADSIEEFEDEYGNYYQSILHKQRFYKKWVYEGVDFTMIFNDTQTDGMKYFSIFDNTKRLKK